MNTGKFFPPLYYLVYTNDQLVTELPLSVFTSSTQQLNVFRQESVLTDGVLRGRIGVPLQ